MTAVEGEPIAPMLHPAIVRLTHWLDAVAVVIMIMSGWQIYNASPFFPFAFPNWMTLGGWLAGAIQWHFAAMWLFMANGLIYLGYGIASGRIGTRFFPILPVLRDLRDALRGGSPMTTCLHRGLEREKWTGSARTCSGSRALNTSTKLS